VISGNAIKKITAESEDFIYNAQNCWNKIELCLAFGAIDERLKNELTGFSFFLSFDNLKIQEIALEYIKKIQDKTKYTHLSVICGLLGSYGILILLFAAIHATDAQPCMTSFLWWSNICIFVFLAICMIAEGKFWCKKIEREYLDSNFPNIKFLHPMCVFVVNKIIHKICFYTNKLLHPNGRTVLIVFIALFVFFILSLNGLKLYTPEWISGRTIFYITFATIVIGFVAYLFMTLIIVWVQTCKYRTVPILKDAKENIEDFEKHINKKGNKKKFKQIFSDVAEMKRAARVEIT
jgi:hypothetical protein